jgi:hypothetical protein
MSKTPTTVKFSESAKQRLVEFTAINPVVAQHEMINFAVEELFRSIDSGWQIHFTGEGMKLIFPGAGEVGEVEKKMIHETQSDALNYVRRLRSAGKSPSRAKHK